jgi:hypothetical protein
LAFQGVSSQPPSLIGQPGKANGFHDALPASLAHSIPDLSGKGLQRVVVVLTDDVIAD